jgi:hypothetical protein
MVSFLIRNHPKMMIFTRMRITSNYKNTCSHIADIMYLPY